MPNSCSPRTWVGAEESDPRSRTSQTSAVALLGARASGTRSHGAPGRFNLRRITTRPALNSGSSRTSHSLLGRAGYGIRHGRRHHRQGPPPRAGRKRGTQKQAIGRSKGGMTVETALAGVLLANPRPGHWTELRPCNECSVLWRVGHAQRSLRCFRSRSPRSTCWCCGCCGDGRARKER
jgi:hypothetical protein